MDLFDRVMKKSAEFQQAISRRRGSEGPSRSFYMAVSVCFVILNERTRQGKCPFSSQFPYGKLICDFIYNINTMVLPVPFDVTIKLDVA